MTFVQKTISEMYNLRYNIIKESQLSKQTIHLLSAKYLSFKFKLKGFERIVEQYRNEIEFK